VLHIYAWPGDTLAVHLKRFRLNRGTAGSGTGIVPSALGPGYSKRGRQIDPKGRLPIGLQVASLPHGRIVYAGRE